MARVDRKRANMAMTFAAKVNRAFPRRVGHVCRLAGPARGNGGTLRLSCP